MGARSTGIEGPVGCGVCLDAGAKCAGCAERKVPGWFNRGCRPGVDEWLISRLEVVAVIGRAYVRTSDGGRPADGRPRRRQLAMRLGLCHSHARAMTEWMGDRRADGRADGLAGGVRVEGACGRAARRCCCLCCLCDRQPARQRGPKSQSRSTSRSRQGQTARVAAGAAGTDGQARRLCARLGCDED